MKVALVQLNPTVGDLAGNRRLVQEGAKRAKAAGAKLAIFPEMVLTGYPPMDLLERKGFVQDQLKELETLKRGTKGMGLLLGAVYPADDPWEKRLLNSAVLLANGEMQGGIEKSLLPTYDVFDERRYFRPAYNLDSIFFRDVWIGATICEDAWSDALGYRYNPVTELVADGARWILNLSASPWSLGRPVERLQHFSGMAAHRGVPMVFVNQVGGNDELIFDGGSFAFDAQGKLLCALPLFEPGFAVVEIGEEAFVEDAAMKAAKESKYMGSPPSRKPPKPPMPAPALDIAPPEDWPHAAAELKAGLVLGLRDYFSKQNLTQGAVVGLSGGIDSAVTAWLAVQALGAEKVLGIAMPGPFSSEHSLEDALALGKNLGIEVRTVDIRPIYEGYMGIFKQLFGVRSDYGLAQQNIQSRIRGAVLMAVSNAEGRLVLATGNKSEFSMGYCTLYGDTVGGLAVIGDVYKREVYALAHHANRQRELIPRSTLEKPPSAELAAGQLDSDDLPEYAVLDAVLEQVIAAGGSAAGIDMPPRATQEDVERIVRRLDQCEYKRRQAPPVLRISNKAFGSGRRLPIVHRYEP